MKRNVLVVLVLIVLSVINVNFCETAVEEPSEWARVELEELKSTGIYEQDIFTDYKEAITRQEFVSLSVTLFEHLNGEEIIADPNIYFKDTFNIDVIKAATVGITSGTNYLEFDPNGQITREALTKMIITVLELGSINLTDNDSPKFEDDCFLSEWAKEAVYKAKEHHIVGGDNFNKFYPQSNASIEECLLIINRIIKSETTAGFTYEPKPVDENLYVDKSEFNTIQLDGSIYCGTLENEQMNGFGSITFENGYSQTGYFKDNRYNGVINTMKDNTLLHSQICLDQEITNFSEVNVGMYHRFTGYIDKRDKPSGFGVVETDEIVLMPGWLSGPASKHQVGEWVGKLPVGYHVIELKTENNERYLAKGYYVNGIPTGDFEISLTREDGTLVYRGEVTKGLVPVSSYNQEFTDVSGENRIKEFKTSSNFVICEVGRIQNELKEEKLDIQAAGIQIIDIMRSSTLLK